MEPDEVPQLRHVAVEFIQRVDGYAATIVAGTPIFEQGEHTGALPGKLVRAGRDAAVLHAAE